MPAAWGIAFVVDAAEKARPALSPGDGQPAAFRPVELMADAAGPRLRLLDQRRLPREEAYVECRTAEEVAGAIAAMVVRGAPLIGVAAAYGVYLAGWRAAAAWDAGDGGDGWRWLAAVREAARVLAGARPTAVNLSWAVERMLARAEEAVARGWTPGGAADALREEALDLHAEDAAMNGRLARHGAALLPERSTVLTYCNTGSLAASGPGTALGVIRAARALGKKVDVLACETRPFLQGARLTAWELLRDGFTVTLITDNMAGHFLRRGEVDAVLVGADRICRNGDVANKIGTYSLAVLARENGVSFYVAAPWSSVDLSLADGDSVVIEERDAAEVTGWDGVLWAPEGVAVRNPAFDVTPARYVTAIITDRGVARPPLPASLAALARGDGDGA